MNCPKCGQALTTTTVFEPIAPELAPKAGMVIAAALIFGVFTAGIGLIIGLIVVGAALIPVPKQGPAPCGKCGYRP